MWMLIWTNIDNVPYKQPPFEPEITDSTSSGKDIILSFLHSGLDSGYIFQKLKLEDLIVLMPTTPDVHTPKERVNIDSYVRTYEYLKKIIERC